MRNCIMSLYRDSRVAYSVQQTPNPSHSLFGTFVASVLGLTTQTGFLFTITIPETTAMQYHQLETEKYYVAATQQKIKTIHNRQAIHSFQTFVFGVLAIGVGLYLNEQYPNWLPELVNILEAQTSKWV